MNRFLCTFILVNYVLILFSCSSSANKPEAKNDNPAATDSTSVTTVEQNQTESTATQSDSSFGSFIKLFNNPGTDVPESVRSFLDVESVGHVTTKGVLETQPFHLVLYSHFMPVGPGMEIFHAASFSQEGTMIADLKLGSSYPSSGPDGGGEECSYDYDAQRHVLKVTNSTIGFDEKSQEEFTTDVISFYLLEEDGTFTSGRKYPQVSKEYLEASSLASYSKDELKIMRNEIFAVHGYVFKSEPVKSHYSAMRWYKPQFENVDDLLNSFEKANVKIIRQVEDQK